VISFDDRLIGKMKRVAFKQFQLLWETSMLCIHWCYPIRLAKAFFFTRREKWWMTMLKRIPMIILVWTYACYFVDHSYPYMGGYILTYHIVHF